jgi:hypothetical protein
MNRSQREEATIIAAKAIDAGADPESMVHILYYSDNNPDAEEGILGLSTPISYENWRRGGYTCKYYQLGELAKQMSVSA